MSAITTVTATADGQFLEYTNDSASAVRLAVMSTGTPAGAVVEVQLSNDATNYLTDNTSDGYFATGLGASKVDVAPGESMRFNVSGAGAATLTLSYSVLSPNG